MQPESALVVQVDNDEFAGINKKDRWYTSGVKASRVRQSDVGSGQVAPVLATLCAGVSTQTSNWQSRHIGFGQNLYTQSIRTRTVPLPNDRPIAAYLFASAGAAMGNDYHQAGMNLELGVTGPGALGEDVQNGLHDLIGRARVPAWSFQLRPRLGANVHLNCLQRWPAGSLDWLTGYSASLGTMLNQASLELAIAAGPGRASAQFGREARLMVPTIKANNGWSLVVGARVRWVAYDALLDGRTFGYESEVQSRPVVGEFFIGFSFNLVRDWQLQATLIQRTDEFEGPNVAQENYEPQRFGTLRLHIPL